MKTIAFLCHKQKTQNQKSRNILRDDACNGNAGNLHTANNNKEEVQDDIQDTGECQIVERALCIADCAENRITEIVEAECWHAEEVNSKVDNGICNQLILCVHRSEDGRREEDAENGNYDSSTKT